MSVSQRPPIPSLIPESAPFTVEQRTWLNGLFAGLFGLPENVTPVSTADATKLLAGLLDGAVGAAVPQNDAAGFDDGAPWHDPAMPMPDRMKLADGKPLPRRLMAAMAQQDCGQCGYNCKDYADALFAKSEKRLNLCVPGGKETSRMLKQLYQELDGAALVPKLAQPKAAEAQAQSAHAAAPGRSRDNPVYATPSTRAAGSTSPVRKKKPGMSTSILLAPISIMWSAISSAFSLPMIMISSRACCRRSTCRRTFPSATAPSARRSLTAFRSRRRRICCSSLSPI
jgi:hypothetical protein